MVRGCLPPRQSVPMAVVREPNAEPIPGYRLLEPLGSGGFGEVWKCEAPGGFLKALKFVIADQLALSDETVGQELKALQRLKTIRHPYLISVERVELVEPIADHGGMPRVPGRSRAALNQSWPVPAGRQACRRRTRRRRTARALRWSEKTKISGAPTGACIY